MAERWVARCQLQASTEVVRRQGPVSDLESPAAPDAVGFRALEQIVQLPHQGIGRTSIDISPLGEMRLCPAEIALAAISHGKRIVNAGGLWIQDKRVLEVFHGLRVVLEREGRTAGA